MARGRKTSLTIRLTPAERQTLLAWQRATTILRGGPDGAGLSYSWPMGCRSPTLLPRSGSAVALSTNGCSGFWRRAVEGLADKPATAIVACRAKPALAEQHDVSA